MTQQRRISTKVLEKVYISSNISKKKLFTCVKYVFGPYNTDSLVFRYYSTYNTITVVFSIYQSKYHFFQNFGWIFFFVVSFRTFQTPETLKNILDSPNNRKKNYLHVLSMCLVHITLIHWWFRYYSTYNTITVVFSIYQSKYTLFPKFWWIFFFVGSFRIFQIPETLKIY